jgi:hypothetical protein
MSAIKPRRIDLPGGVSVLRAAVDELLKSGWDEVFRRRAREIAIACEGSFRAAGKEDLARTSYTITLLLEIEPREAVMLGKSLRNKLDELLGHLDALLRPEGEIQTG